MKTVTTFGRVLSFSLFLGLALATQGQAEEHYIYKSSHGNLVISNQTPPPGSNVLRRLELPEVADPQVQRPHEGSDMRLNGPEPSEDSAKRSQNK